MRILRGRLLTTAITLSAGAALLGTPAASAALQAPPATGYRVIDLGTLGGGGTSLAHAINERGHVAGESNGHPVMWRDGQIIDLGFLPGGTRGVAIGINDRDEVVGYNDTINGINSTITPFLWRDGHMQPLSLLPGGDFGFAVDINNAGDIVGSSNVIAHHISGHAVRWHQGRITDLDPAGVASSARDITNNGWIVGTVTTPEEPFTAIATAWQDDRPIALFTGGANAANERHDVVGQFVSADRENQVQIGYLWSRGKLTVLPRPDNTTFSSPAGINNAGLIAGRIGDGAHDFAVLWQEGRLFSLPSLAGGASEVSDINNRGQVVGSSSTNPDPFDQHAVLWTR